MRTSTVPARGPGSLAEHHDLTRRLELHVRALARPRHRVAQPLANQQTRERVCDLLSAWGYEVGLQGPYHNVVATPAGASGPLPAVCAHCDSVPCTPGADDNASALAVMLEVARLAAAAAAPLTVISFNAEEDNLAGSRDFVASRRAGKRMELSVAHVLEMVGFTATEQRLPPVPRWLLSSVPTTGDFIGVVANQRSIPYLRQVLEAARKHPHAPPMVGLKAYLGAERLLPDLGRSDHAPFWQAGIPSLMWTDTAEYRNPNYHGPTDTPDTLDYAFMVRVASLLYRTVAGAVPPGLSW